MSKRGQFPRSVDNWIVTVDPHLHCRTSMSEVYSVPVGVGHAAAKLSAWILEHVPNAFVIGPDVESEQWVRAVAEDAGAPYAILEKTRRGDLDVEFLFPDLEQWRGRTPILVDDIISSGRTMEVALRHLHQLGFTGPVCLGVHGLFAEDAFERLIAAGASRIVSTNTVPHRSNTVDVADIVAKAACPFLL